MKPKKGPAKMSPYHRGKYEPITFPEFTKVLTSASLNAEWDAIYNAIADKPVEYWDEKKKATAANNDMFKKLWEEMMKDSIKKMKANLAVELEGVKREDYKVMIKTLMLCREKLPSERPILDKIIDLVKNCDKIMNT